MVFNSFLLNWCQEQECSNKESLNCLTTTIADENTATGSYLAELKSAKYSLYLTCHNTTYNFYQLNSDTLQYHNITKFHFLFTKKKNQFIRDFLLPFRTYGWKQAWRVFMWHPNTEKIRLTLLGRWGGGWISPHYFQTSISPWKKGSGGPKGPDRNCASPIKWCKWTVWIFWIYFGHPMGSLEVLWY